MGEEGDFFPLYPQHLSGVDLVQSVLGHEGSTQVKAHGESIDDQRLEGVLDVGTSQSYLELLSRFAQDFHFRSLLGGVNM